MTEKLRFNGSVWVNLDVALRNVETIFRTTARTLNLTVVEWYILRTLYEQSVPEQGLHASDLARSVGRAATSFTPNLNKLIEKGLITRKIDDGDRRAVLIHLTPEAEKYRETVLRISVELDESIASHFDPADLESFHRVIVGLQTMLPNT